MTAERTPGQTMRAAVVVAHGGLEKIEIRHDYPVPRPAGDEVLLRVGAVALNYHDIFSRRGMPGIKVPLPIVTGSDIAGEVAQIGAAVQGWHAGERVLVDPVYRDGRRFGLIGEVSDGGRAEYVAVPASQLVRMPESMSWETAAALPIAYGTAYRMLCVRGGLRRDETVLILGASGGVGVACVQLAKMIGARVIACASSQAKLQKLQAIGADELILHDEQSLAVRVADIVGKPRINGQGGVDVVINFTGGDTWEQTQRCVKLGGRILTCGATAGYSVNQDMRYLWTFEHTVIGSNGWTHEDVHSLVSLVAEGRLEPVIGHTLPLEQAAEAERLLEERRVFGKVLLTP